ncbi:hypothetical protein RIR_jg38285.t1 [Rhizophagus irregularis DAOM 181602=DAOM 197198]|nr:hypothetical protein RIR_jg38285.t1 [Rhizophagus irregularis DAOM 181602=DAOM 197198]
MYFRNLEETGRFYVAQVDNINCKSETELEYESEYDSEYDSGYEDEYEDEYEDDFMHSDFSVKLYLNSKELYRI